LRRASAEQLPHGHALAPEELLIEQRRDIEFVFVCLWASRGDM
jgi:hypothetical protein